MRRFLRRRWKWLVGLVAGLLVLLVLNAITVDNETKSAKATDGRILALPGAELQVKVDGPRRAPPIVLLHCYTCAINWWDRITPYLDRDFRVVRIDLLGHGGSEKPSSGYSMQNQARLVALALGQLGVQRATVVGHSMGAAVATALAQESPELVERIVDIDEPPSTKYANTEFLAELAYVPLLGQAIWRLAPDSQFRDGLSKAFAKGYPVPDQFVSDLTGMTYTAFKHAADAENGYIDAVSLDRRLQQAGKPLLVIFGSEDQLIDPKAAQVYRDVPGAQIATIPGAGHSPNVEKPAQTAALILEFARQAGDEALKPESPGAGRRAAKAKATARATARVKRRQRVARRKLRAAKRRVRSHAQSPKHGSRGK